MAKERIVKCGNFETCKIDCLHKKPHKAGIACKFPCERFGFGYDFVKRCYPTNERVK